MSARSAGTDSKGLVHCDAFGCNETHPLEHDCLGEPCFGSGRWLGWVYLDPNRPDLFPRELRFCSVRCALWWMEREAVTWHVREPTPLDLALRSPNDVVARRRAGLRLSNTEQKGAMDK